MFKKFRGKIAVKPTIFYNLEKGTAQSVIHIFVITWTCIMKILKMCFNYKINNSSFY